MKYKLLTLTLLFFTFSTPSLANDLNIHEELSPKIDNEQVEIRAYKHQDGASITEYKSGGKVWMIKVEPGGNFPAYYLYDNEGSGIFEQRIMGNKQPTAPMWIIKSF
jgi:hypothetical protein